MDDVPFSIEIPLYYINTLLEGFAQKRTETVYGEEHIRQSFGVAYDVLEWDLTGVRNTSMSEPSSYSSELQNLGQVEGLGNVFTRGEP